MENTEVELPRKGRLINCKVTYNGGDVYEAPSFAVWDGPKGDKGDGIRLKGAVESIEDLQAIESPSMGDCYTIEDTTLIGTWSGTEWLTTPMVGSKGPQGETGNGIASIDVDTQEIEPGTNSLDLTFILDDESEYSVSTQVSDGKAGRSYVDVYTTEDVLITSYVPEGILINPKAGQIHEIYVNGVLQAKGYNWTLDNTSYKINFKDRLHQDDLITYVYADKGELK